MSFPVAKLAPEFIGPSDPTPFQTLPLSFMDRLPNMSFFLELILVFAHGNNPAKAIREALPKALLPYYPVAGRIIHDAGSGQPVVACNDAGLLFVEASTCFSLRDVNYLDALLPLMIQKEKLLPSPLDQSHENGVIFMMQVTQFICGGFTVGIKFNHAVFDGIGAAQFIKAVSEKAKGLREPTVEPVWRRESIPNPPELPKVLKLTLGTTFKFERLVVDISLNYVNQLKDQFLIATGEKCSAFEIIAAKIWQCRTRAIVSEQDAEAATLRFPANVRGAFRNLTSSQKEGYYGNCIHHIIIQAPSDHVVNAPLTGIVRLIRDAKAGGISEKFLRWMKGDPCEDPPELTQTSYALLDLSDWRRLGVSDVDYGWGTPMHVIPTNEGVKVGSCIFLNAPAPRMGVRLMTHCVVKQHLKAFRKEMEKLA